MKGSNISAQRVPSTWAKLVPNTRDTYMDSIVTTVKVFLHFLGVPYVKTPYFAHYMPFLENGENKHMFLRLTHVLVMPGKFLYPIYLSKPDFQNLR